MKKFVIPGAVCAAVGIILIIAAVIWYWVSPDQLRSLETVNRHYSSDEIHRLDISIDNGDITVAVSEDEDLFGLQFIGYDSKYHVLVHQDKTLKITARKGPLGWGFDFFSRFGKSERTNIFVTVPQSAVLKSASLNTVNGKLRLYNLQIEGDLSSSIVNGSVEAWELQASAIRVDAVNAESAWHRVLAGRMDFSTVNGDANFYEMPGSAQDYHIERTGLSGSISVNGENVGSWRPPSAFRTIRWSGVNGSVWLDTVK